MFLKNVKAGRPGRNFNLEEKNYFSICLPAISQRKIEQMHVQQHVELAKKAVKNWKQFSATLEGEEKFGI